MKQVWFPVDDNEVGCKVAQSLKFRILSAVVFIHLHCQCNLYPLCRITLTFGIRTMAYLFTILLSVRCKVEMRLTHRLHAQLDAVFVLCSMGSFMYSNGEKAMLSLYDSYRYTHKFSLPTVG